MARGGKRANAGRKNGSTTKRRRPVKDEAQAKGMSPGDVLQALMDRHYKAKDWDRAQAAARDLAPYRHPRLAAVHLMGLEAVLATFPPELAAAARTALSADLSAN